MAIRTWAVRQKDQGSNPKAPSDRVHFFFLVRFIFGGVGQIFYYGSICIYCPNQVKTHKEKVYALPILLEATS